MENHFAENLKILRSEKGVGQIELANAIKVSKGIISLWENEKREPTLSSLIAISQFFDITIDELIK